MRKTAPTVPADRKIFYIILLVFLLNTLFLAAGFYYLNSRLPDEAEEFAIKQKMAKELVEYNRRLAKSLDVETRSPVREALARFSYDIDLATSTEGLNKAILANGQRSQEKILQENEAKQRETALAIIRQDPRINLVEGKTRLTVKLSREHGLQVEPAGFLSDETMTKISEAVMLGLSERNLTVDIGIEDGNALLATPYNPLEHILALTRDLDAGRVTLHELRSRAGFAEMIGPGIIVRIFDAENGFTTESIIHETDVRDTINELFAAGAQGVAVGGQRLIATSAIRCVGPSILVNDARIPVNPVVILAIGNPEVLASGLDIIRVTLEVTRNLYFEIEKVDNLALPAYSR